MSHDHGALVAQFRETLTQRRYNPVVVHNYCRNADHFLSYLRKRKIALKVVTPTEVSNYLCPLYGSFVSATAGLMRPGGPQFQGPESTAC